MTRAIPLLALLAACSGQEIGVEEGLLGQGPLSPYPNGLLFTEGQLDLPVEAVPIAVHPDEGTLLTPFPADRVAWRTGLSSGQASVLVIDDVDASALPGWHSSQAGSSGVRMYDLDTGLALPVMAELDAWCTTAGLDTDPCEGARPSLIVRPLVALERDHRIAVVVTTAAAPRPEHYDRVMRERKGPVVEHQAELHERLAEVGVAEDEIAVAWDFPVADAGTPLRSALSQVAVPDVTTFIADVVQSSDNDDDVPPGIWKVIEGRLTVSDFLIDDRTLDAAADGTVALTGTVEADVHITIPESARSGTDAPVLLFGHGLFGSPQGYLGDQDDEQQVSAVAATLGAVTVATTMRGLTANDRLEALEVAADFGKFPLVTDRVIQGQAATRALLEAAANGLFEQPDLLGSEGQAVTDGSDVIYYGISLGGIEGQVLLAQDYPIDAAVLHVPGGMWSTMLERSTQWTPFELVIARAIESPSDRQLLYAISQSLWDPVDPINYVPELRDKTFLLQESLGDEQVANLTTRIMARSVGVPVLEPAVEVPWGIETTSSPSGPGARALTQFDPMVGIPDDVNRPASNTRAHSIPRTWANTRDQTIEFLTRGQRGTVVHTCGADPCSEANTGG